MRKRPYSVAVIAWAYIGAGAVGFAYHFNELLRQPLQHETLWVQFIRLIAILIGVLLLRGHYWGPRLALGWMAFHVILSAFHTPVEFAMHLVLLALISWFLSRPAAYRYFHRERVGPHAAPSRFQS
jgi:hypothetical protein